MSNVEAIKNRSDCLPATNFFNVEHIERTEETLTLEFCLHPVLIDWQRQPASTLGLIVDYVTSLIGQTLSGSTTLVEFEASIYHAALPDKLKVMVMVEPTIQQHTVFCCTIFALENYPKQRLAESHGTLLQN